MRGESLCGAHPYPNATVKDENVHFCCAYIHFGLLIKVSFLIVVYLVAPLHVQINSV